MAPVPTCSFCFSHLKLLHSRIKPKLSKDWYEMQFVKLGVYVLFLSG